MNVLSDTEVISENFELVTDWERGEALLESRALTFDQLRKKLTLAPSPNV